MLMMIAKSHSLLYFLSYIDHDCENHKFPSLSLHPRLS